MQVSQILSCSVCLMELTEPVSISCEHTFCKKCLTELLKNQQFPSCPLCRKPTFAPIGTEWATDDLLTEVLRIAKEEGEAELLSQFQSIVMCLSCGTTPTQPTVLNCQHLFCHDCLQRHLQEELICPACNEWAPYLPNNIPTNPKYCELIDWYEQKMGFEHMSEEKQTSESNNNEIRGMPIFFYDQATHHKQTTELCVVEDRYQQLLKIAANGSGLFPIVNLIKSNSDLPIYADLVEITKIKQLNQKQIYVQTQGTQRVVIKQIYTIGQNGNKLQFNLDLYRNFPGQLWMCDFELLNDKVHNHQKEILLSWNKINTVLQQGYEDLPNELKQVFYETFSKMSAQKKTQLNLNSEEDITSIQNASLILIRMLTIPATQYKKLYYTDNLMYRLQCIYEHLCQIQQKIMALLGQDCKQQKMENEKPIQLEESHIKLPQFDESDDEDDQDLALLQFKDLTIGQTIFMNCFRIENLIQLQN